MRVLVLGATGFIGGHILNALARDIGRANIVAGVRRTGQAVGTGIEQRIVDATDPESVRRASHDVGCVINSVMGSDAAIIASARIVGQLVRDGAIERAVHLSSIAVHGVTDGTVRESDAPGKPADEYAAAKIEAETLFGHAAGQGGVVLRPGLVHGPGSALWTRRIGRLVAAGRLGPLGRGGEGLCNLVDVRDVADAAVSACTMQQAGGRAFALVAAPAPTWNAYLRDLAMAMQVPVRSVTPFRLGLERAAAYPLTALRGPAGRLGLTLPDAITPGLARLFPVQMRFESSAPGLILPGWRSYEGSLRDGADWLASL